MFQTRQRYLRTGGSAIVAISAAGLLFASMSTPTSADPIERGIQGAIGGAVIGGVIGGGKGAARGAGIGAAIGIIGGAAEEANRERAYRDRPRSYREPTYRRSSVNRSELVYDIQKRLTALGYDPGPADGISGDRTAEAISAYQDDNNLQVDGVASNTLLDHMIAHGG